MKLFAVAVAIQIGDADHVESPVFVIEQSNEETAAADAIQVTHETFRKMYGVEEGRYKILNFSAEEIPLETLQEYIKRNHRREKAGEL